MDWISITKGKPFVTNIQVVSLVKERYEFEVKEIKALEGYDSQNFLLEVVPLNKEQRSLETDQLTTKYVLKVTNYYLSKADQHLRDVTRMMEFLNSKGFSCTQPVPKRGDLFELLTFQNLALKSSENGTIANHNSEDTFMVRMVTFLPGTTLNVIPFVPDNVFEEMGETLAQVHIALQELDMDKKALQEMGEIFPWSLDCLNKCRDFIYVVEVLEKRQLVEDIINDFERIVLPKKEELPHGFLHGDFNTHNIIADVQELDSNEAHMTGFIDFDYAFYNCTVYDVGIALMNILQCKSLSRDSAARHFLQGYSKYRKMTQLEKDCLIYCTAGRFVQSLIAGLYSYSISKDHYCLEAQERGWDALNEMWTRGKAVYYQKWKFS